MNIDGVPRLAWGQGQDCTFAGALAAATAPTEHPYSYAEWMGYSGLAFRLRWANDETATKWCPSCAVGELPDEHAALERLAGYQVLANTEVQFGQDQADTGAIRDKIVASIDAGKPVVAYASSYDMAVIVGYEDGGEMLLVHDYSKSDNPFKMPVAEIGPMQTYLGTFQTPPPPREQLIEALKIAVRNWRHKIHDGGIAGREYWYGEAAFKAWMRDIDRFEAMDGETQKSMFHLDSWVMALFYDARKAAITFLNEQAAPLKAEARQSLEHAAAAYRHVTEIMEPIKSLKSGIKSPAEWSTEARRTQRDVLAEVYQFEAQAISHIEQACMQSADNAETGQERVILENVDSYQVMDPMFESVRILLNSLGETYSPAYVQGISGSAFRTGGICPCAPTCACAMSTQDLLTVFGYEFEHLSLFEESMDLDKEVPTVIARVKDEIRGGHPVIVWHAFTWAEWDVVAGFDDGSNQFVGRGSYAGLDEYATAAQGRMATCGDICPPMGAILVGEKTGEYDARKFEIAALQEAVAHARSTENVDKLDGENWVMLYGLACYDRWIGDFETNPPRLPTMGDRYCIGVNRSTHCAAAGFMRELMPKYPAVQDAFERAAEHFVAEADTLNEAAEMLFPGWQLPKEPNQEINVQIAALLRTARDHYAAAIDEIEHTLGEIVQ